MAFDSWYSGLENLKAVRAYGWTFLTRLKVNRKVDLDRQGYRAVAETAIAPAGRSFIWRGSGRSVSSRSSPETGTLNTGRPTTWRWTRLTRLALAEQCWGIEKYHRGLKQCCGVERARCGRRAQRNHIGLAIRAFLRLEHHFYTTGVSWYEAKARIIRGAVRAYIANPVYKLP